MRRRLPDGKDVNMIPFKCPNCKAEELDLAIAEHMKWEEAGTKRREERREQALRNEGLGPLSRVNKLLGQANAALADTAKWFRKFKENNSPNADREPGSPRRASWPPANDSTPVPGASADIPLESVEIRTPEPTYQPSASPLTQCSGNQSSPAAVDSHKKQDEENVPRSGKENKKNKERYDGWPQPMDG